MTPSVQRVFQVSTRPVSPEEWAQWIDQFDDATYFQSWPYAPLLWGAEHSGQLVVRDGQQVVAACRPWVRVLPVIQRGFAHVSWGPMWRPRGHALDPSVVEAMLGALIEEFAHRRRLLLRIRFNVVADDAESEMVGAIASNLGFRPHAQEPAYTTYRLDLSSPIQEIRNGLRPRWRGHLNQAERQGLEIEEGTGSELFARFSRLYAELLDRKRFTRFVADMDFFLRLQAELEPSQKMRVFLCTKEGEDLAALVIPYFGDTGMYALGATSSQCVDRRLKASYLLHWRAISWLKSAGARYYDLRGGLDDSMAGVRNFKKGLRGDEIAFLGSWEYCQDGISRALVHGGERLAAGAAAMKQRFRGGPAS